VRCRADWQTGTLSGLLTLSDNLPKLDAQFTATVTKCHDTLRSLVSDPRELTQHTRVNDRPAEEYVLPIGPNGSIADAGGGLWRWDAGRWGNGGKVGDVLEALTTVSPPHALAGNICGRQVLIPCRK
jgi:V-type H+-transporting ATPase subunit C